MFIIRRTSPLCLVCFIDLQQGALAPQAEIILVGDFNLNDVDWTRRLMLKNSVDLGLFSDILSDNFLTQMFLQPTRGDSI